MYVNYILKTSSKHTCTFTFTNDTSRGPSCIKYCHNSDVQIIGSVTISVIRPLSSIGIFYISTSLYHNAIELQT